MEATGAEEFVPQQRTLPALRRAVGECRGCDLYRNATQAVFGDGAPSASLVLVGEQPGDAEDLQGAPFVGPAGRLLDHALEAAGIDRADTYVTNAVKHFRFVRRGKQRIHQGPKRTQVVACRPWLLAELEAIGPRGVVLLGSTAGQSFFGSGFRVGEQRGKPIELPGWPAWSVATIHPSAALRSPNREELFDGLVSDLAVAAALLRQTA